MNLQSSIASGICLVLCSLASLAVAADAPAGQETVAQKALARDAVCTACHNEGWITPVLTIYQTPHGNRADARAPTCQGCHGESSAHVKDPSGARPDTASCWWWTRRNTAVPSLFG